MGQGLYLLARCALKKLEQMSFDSEYCAEDSCRARKKSPMLKVELVIKRDKAERQVPLPNIKISKLRKAESSEFALNNSPISPSICTGRVYTAQRRREDVGRNKVREEAYQGKYKPLEVARQAKVSVH
eukprot:TRINITY_DN2089_c0_g2_i2.p3 TRINITY_DN2089_c0_g2~~TRINITY_DN2089_c0_g2_i2.p3  ORF type:complete len:128 (+),score=26.73 TRINITY_DN2089_c0_g2_i2:708-1091(+)